MPLPDSVARLNRYVANPITRTFAGRVPWFALVVHRGRKSKRIYHTPVMAFGADDGFVIALTYGADRDWVKNVLAAGRCGLVIRSRRIKVNKPVIVEGESGMAQLPALPKPILKLLHVDQFLRLRRV